MSKVIVITGASSGIGLATAQALLQKEYTVYCLSRSAPNEKNLKHIKCDVTNRDEITSAFKQIFENEKQIDVVINNAGMGISGPVEFEPQEDIDRIINVNFGGMTKVSAVAMPYLRQSKGVLLNVSSMASEFPIPFQTLYSATKAAVQNFSMALANEVRPYGVRVCCLLPGDVKTEFTKNRVKAPDEKQNVYSKRVESSVARMEKDEQNGMPASAIAKKVAKVIEKKHPPVCFTVGTQYKLFRFLKRIVPTGLFNKILYSMYGK